MSRCPPPPRRFCALAQKSTEHYETTPAGYRTREIGRNGPCRDKLWTLAAAVDESPDQADSARPFRIKVPPHPDR